MAAWWQGQVQRFLPSMLSSCRALETGETWQERSKTKLRATYIHLYSPKIYIRQLEVLPSKSSLWTKNPFCFENSSPGSKTKIQASWTKQSVARSSLQQTSGCRLYSLTIPFLMRFFVTCEGVLQGSGALSFCFFWIDPCNTIFRIKDGQGHPCQCVHPCKQLRRLRTGLAAVRWIAAKVAHDFLPHQLQPAASPTLAFNTKHCRFLFTNSISTKVKSTSPAWSFPAPFAFAPASFQWKVMTGSRSEPHQNCFVVPS